MGEQEGTEIAEGSRERREKGSTNELKEAGMKARTMDDDEHDLGSACYVMVTGWPWEGISSINLNLTTAGAVWIWATTGLASPLSNLIGILLIADRSF